MPADSFFRRPAARATATSAGWHSHRARHAHEQYGEDAGSGLQLGSDDGSVAGPLADAIYCDLAAFQTGDGSSNGGHAARALPAVGCVDTSPGSEHYHRPR
jgi:hypothetical protein